MTNKFLPLLALPFLLASCGGTAPSIPNVSLPQISTPVTMPITTPVIKDAGSQTRSAEEQTVFDAINAARAVARQCGDRYMPAAPALTWNGYLAAAAQGHAQDMATKGYFGHTAQDGRTLSQRVQAAGYNGWTEVGENIAAGYGVTNVLDSWLSSPGHCQTLMDPTLKEIGLSYVKQAGSKLGTYWVSDFGTR